MTEEKPGEPRVASPAEGGGSESKTEHHHMIPVWFFVGLLLLIYGILIFIQGVEEWSHPPHTVLSNLHPPVWWGILLIVMGAIFIARHVPRSKP